MAIIVFTEIPGGNAEKDQQMMQAVGVAPGKLPAGASLRAAGPIDGGWRVISIWDSEDSWNKFRRETLEPAWKQMGVQPQAKVSQLNSVMMAPQQ